MCYGFTVLKILFLFFQVKASGYLVQLSFQSQRVQEAGAFAVLVTVHGKNET